MRQRGARRPDVRAAILSSLVCIYQLEDGGRWRLEGGCDLAGDGLTVVLSFRGGMLVVTIF